jgi:Lrp/AsnC family transcriptional regulator, regulator for asnA, asnC and gidA
MLAVAMSDRPKIDFIDVQILHTLQLDPRATYFLLAKNSKTSIDSVRRRYARLKNEGIIVREIITLRPQAYGNECLAWLGIVTQNGKEHEVLQSLKQRSDIMMNFVEIGKYNIRSVITVKRLEDLELCIDSLKKIPSVGDIDAMIWTGVERMAYPENLVIEPFTGDANANEDSGLNASEVWTSSTTRIGEGVREVEVPFNMLCPSIDKMDERILNILLHNARTPFSHIAEQIGISTKTVIGRYLKLKKRWVAYATLSLNLRKLGYLGYASHHIKVSSKSWVTDVFDKITRIPNVIAALKLIGPYNMHTLSPFSTPEQLMSLYESISRISGIEKIDVQIGNSMDVWPGA